MSFGDTQQRQREIGRRVARWRTRRGLTRKQFGDLCGRSVSWVDKVESGERGLVRIPMLERVAEVLHVPVSALTGPTTAGKHQHAEGSLDAFEVSAIRTALQSYQAISRVFQPTTTGNELPDLGRLKQDVTYAWTAFQNARWPQLGQVLPRLLTSAQVAAAAHTGEDDAALRARALLSQAYQVTASTLWKLNEADLAWLAAERSLTLAERTGDTLLISDAARRVAQGLMTMSHHDQALELLRADISRLEPRRGNGSAAYLSMYGMLFLLGSVVAAQARNGRLARDLLHEGHSVADQLGRDGNERFTAFGPTNVRLHEVAALLELGDGHGALDAIRHVTPDGLVGLPKERRANFHLDVARAHVLAGQHSAAAHALLRADALFPDELVNRPTAVRLVGGLLRRTSTALTADLRPLAARMRMDDRG